MTNGPSQTDIFTPFMPSPSIVPGAPEQAPQSRRPRAKPVTEAAKAPKRKRKIKAVNTPVEGTTKMLDAPPAKTKRPRKVRTTAKVRQPRGLKLPVNTMLTAMGGLRGDDSAVFEKMLGILSAAAKGQRSRVLGALGKVFA